MSSQTDGLYYVHYEQNEPSSVWVITHDGGDMTPIAECFDTTTSQRIYPLEVKATNQNTVTISFSSPQTGKAYII